MPVQKRRLAPGNCNHCGIDETMTSLWRTGLNKEKLCNACGLYVQTHGRMRPLATLGGRKKTDATKASRESATYEPRDDFPLRGRQAKVESKPRNPSLHSSLSSSVSSLAYAPYANETRHSRSASISTTASSSLPSPAFSTAEFPSPPRTIEDSPPPSIMSASLGRLDDLSMSQTGIPADNEFSARAKKGQKRHSISGGSALGFPFQNPNPNHVILKVPTNNKKKARFDQQPIRPLTSLSSTLPSTLYGEGLMSQSVPVSSPIGIPPSAPASSLRVPTVCLPCSKCAELLPLRSSSVPLSEDPVCERCSEGPRISPPHHQRACSSSSVPIRSNSHLLMSSSYPATPRWDFEDADYEFISKPQQQSSDGRSKTTDSTQYQDEWSLEEEFSFLDTSFNVEGDTYQDNMEDVVAPLPPHGWGGPFFRNMPMPTPKMAPPPLPSPGPGPQYPFATAAHSFLGIGVNGHPRSATTPDTVSSSSSVSPQSSFSTFNSGYPSPVAGLMCQPLPQPQAHHYPPQPHPTSTFKPDAHFMTSSLGLANLNLAQRRGLASAKINLSSPHQAFLQAAQSRVNASINHSRSSSSSNGYPSPRGLGDLEFLVRGAPSPVEFGMKRSGMHLDLGNGSAHHGGTQEDDHMDMLMMDELVDPAR